MTTKKEWTDIHQWLKHVYGKASTCEASPCALGDEACTFHWCLRAGKEYEKKRENFIQLCATDHRRYDKQHGLLGKYERDEKLTITFTNSQLAFIGKTALKLKMTQAGVVRASVDLQREKLISSNRVSSV